MMLNDDTWRVAALRKQGLEQMQADKLDAAKGLFTQICEISPEDVDAWYMLSNINGMLGKIDEAGECCRRVLSLRPDHCEAHVNLGNVFLSQGRHADAAEQYQRALQLDANHAVAHNNLGNALSAMGRYDEAAASYQSAIRVNPNWLLAYFNLGNLRMTQEQYDKAVNNYKQAILLNPGAAHLDAMKEQAHILLQRNRLGEAKALMTQLCQFNPRDVQAWFTLSIINGRLGAIDEAGDCCRRVLALQPDHGEAHINLGHVFFRQRRFDDAISHYETALDGNPLSIPALNNLAKACQAKNRLDNYIERYRRAIALLPDPTAARAVFIGTIRNRPLSEYDPWIDEELQKYFTTAGIDYRATTSFTAQLLRLKYKIRAPIDAQDGALRELIERIATDKLFLMFLKNAVNTDDSLEVLLTKIRREFLLDYIRERSVDGSTVCLMAALALQGLNNEYVFAFDADEERMLGDLRNDIEQSVPSLHAPDEVLEGKLLVFGMYDSLYSLACREHLSRMSLAAWSENFHPLLEQALFNPLEEERIKAEIPMISDIEDRTSQLVQSQYEENPYPRWVSITENRKRNIGVVLKQWFPHFSPPAFLSGPIRILVAGCGTGKHPIQVALSYENAEVVAVDISKSSLAYATRMARKHKVANIQFLQGDILQLSALDQRFHIIECSGVLHHMEDPLKGWKVLNDLLVEDGLIYIGLYSEIARQQIVAAREIIKNENITPDKRGIRNFRKRLMRREFGDLIYELGRKSYDFYSISGCRDLLFHFMEHRFTLPQIKQVLADLQLDFIGFMHGDAETADLYRDQFPEDKEMRDLLSWDRFERTHPASFARMYQLWCQKKHNA